VSEKRQADRKNEENGRARKLDAGKGEKVKLTRKKLLVRIEKKVLKGGNKSSCLPRTGNEKRKKRTCIEWKVMREDEGAKGGAWGGGNP